MIKLVGYTNLCFHMNYEEGIEAYYRRPYREDSGDAETYGEHVPENSTREGLSNLGQEANMDGIVNFDWVGSFYDRTGR